MRMCGKQSSPSARKGLDRRVVSAALGKTRTLRIAYPVAMEACQDFASCAEEDRVQA